MLVGKKRWRSGSQLKGKVLGGVFCRELPINSCFRLSDHCSVFQAAAIKLAVDVLRRSAASFREICNHSVSRAAIQALSLLTVSIVFFNI